MKKNDKLSNNSWLQRLTLFVVSLICVVGSVQASNRYYYRYTATPTTGGKVYATDDENSTISYSSSASSVRFRILSISISASSTIRAGTGSGPCPP